MNVQQETLGGLSCRITDALPEGVRPALTVVLCHGYGAPGTDLVPLAGEILRLNPNLADKVRLMFPQAPLSLEELGLPQGRAWWHLDVNRIAQAVEQGELRDMREELPEGLPESRTRLTELVEELQQRDGLTTSQIVLGGFSQGAMLATDVALRLEERPAGLCIFSGTLLCEPDWRELAARRGPMPVLMTHGTDDPLLPFQGAEWLRDLLTEAGMDVEFVPFRGMHTIPAEGIARLAGFLGRFLGD